MNREIYEHEIQVTLGEEQYKAITDMAEDLKKKPRDILRILIENEYARKGVMPPLATGKLHRKEKKKTVNCTLTNAQLNMLQEMGNRYHVTSMQLLRQLIEEEYLVWKFQAYGAVI